MDQFEFFGKETQRNLQRRCYRLWPDIKVHALCLAPLIAFLIAGCQARYGTRALTPGMTPEVSQSPRATTVDQEPQNPTPVCPRADGDSTVAPVISIYSIAFVVNGLEQVVFDGDSLQASPGDEVQVREVVICAAPFSGPGGEVCVDLAPVDKSGEEIVSEHAGTHIVPVTPGFMTILWPDSLWVLEDGWRGLSIVLNHWSPTKTEDLGCAGGDCERDDWMFVPIQ